MLKRDLDNISSSSLLDFPVTTEIKDFDKDAWKRVWVQAVEYWSEDGGWWYDSVINGFKGWAERTPYEIYMDLRFTYIDDREMSWDELADENHELGKTS